MIYPDPGQADVTVRAYPLRPDGRIDETRPPRQLFQQPDPPGCITDDIYASPNGRFLLLQYNCEATLAVRLLNIAEVALLSAALPSGYFLDWSPDGDWFLFRDIEAGQVLLVNATDLIANRPTQQALDLPYGTYGATFTPDGRSVTFVASEGLGFGSQMGTLNLAVGDRTGLGEFPRHTIAFPRWSPDGQGLAYIRMADNNVPFTVGELWLANAGEPPAVLADADAGHGYPPVWSPDGQYLAYVHRENPDSAPADHLAGALHSNLYRWEAATGRVTPLTAFAESLVYDAAWSSDGQRLAFTADDAVWLIEPGQPAEQVSPPGVVARHPTYLPDPGEQNGG